MGNTRNLKPFPKGVSGNPGGRHKRDVAALLARRIFDENQAEIIAGLVKALQRGDPAEEERAAGCGSILCLSRILC